MGGDDNDGSDVVNGDIDVHDSRDDIYEDGNNCKDDDDDDDDYGNNENVCAYIMMRVRNDGCDNK